MSVGDPIPKGRGAAVVLLGATLATMLCGTLLSGFQSAAGADPGVQVVVSNSACVPQWSVPASGVASFTVTNRAKVSVAPELVNRANGAVVGSIKILAPETTRPLNVRLRRGNYQWHCIYDHTGPLSSKALRVAPGVRASTATPSAVPVTNTDMAPALTQYDAYVEDQLSALQLEVGAVGADIAQNNLAQAKTDWNTAELTYSGIGGTYGALGGLEDQINGLPMGYPQGVNDPNFQGLHKIEYLLWSGQPSTAVEPFVNDLSRTLIQAQVLWKQGPLTANLLSTRAHEILEDTQRDTLSGKDDLGSGTSLARSWANLQGDQEVMHTLHGILEKRSPKLLSTAETQLGSLGQAIQNTKVNGQWIPLGSITTAQRQQINSDIGQVLETLSPIPDILEIQGFSDAVGAT